MKEIKAGTSPTIEEIKTSLLKKLVAVDDPIFIKEINGHMDFYLCMEAHRKRSA